MGRSSLVYGVLCLFLVAVVYGGGTTPGVYFTKLGGAGSYQQVTNMTSSPWPPPCSSEQHCFKKNVSITATPLAPFNEEVALQLRGPMSISKIAIYQSTSSGYTLVSYWAQGNPSATKNINFLSLSGAWDVCNGNAMGYTTPYANASSSVPTVLNGYLAAGLQITVLSGAACKADYSDCGWFRGVGLHGWSGDKIFVVETTMPHQVSAAGKTDDNPAIWSLNAKIVRTAQYGCNCDRYGCGEFDIAEVINSGDNNCYLTLYSYNNAVGTSAYFPRPVSTPTIFLTHYSISDNRIYALNLPQGCFSYASTLTTSYISNFQAISVAADNFNSVSNTNKTFNC